MDTIPKVKDQYARILKPKDCILLKESGEYYLKTAARLKKQDIRWGNKKLALLLRNTQKRLFLGIGCELILKSFYLREKRCINKLLPTYSGKKTPTHLFSDLSMDDINANDTFTMNSLIDNLGKVYSFQKLKEIKRGFQIAMAFRNKEGHISFPVHEFDPTNYEDIARALQCFYHEAFWENLQFKISMKPYERWIFKIDKGT